MLSEKIDILALESVPPFEHTLDRRLRLALILVDGRSNVGSLHEKAISFDKLEQALEILAMHGFIRANNQDWQIMSPISLEPRSTVRRPSLRAKLIDAAILVLGENAKSVVKILTETPDEMSALEEAVQRCRRLVDLLIDEKRSHELSQKCSQILGNASS